MANTIKLKTSAIQGKSPLVSDLQISEFAWNSFDGKLYGKKNDGTASIVEIGGGSGVSDYNDLTNKPDLSVYALQTTVDTLDGRVDNLENNALITRETPTGLINGSNTVFTLANTPIAGSEQIFVNGVLQESGASNDYTISGGTITFTTAPESGWKVTATYATGNYMVAPGGSSSNSVYQISEFTHPEQNGTYASYTITHNLNTLNPLVQIQANFSPGDGFYPEGGWSNIFDLLYAGGFQGSGYKVVDANTVELKIWRIAGGARQIRGQIASLSSSSGGVSPFRWLTTEQVYPFEVSDDNETLYALKVNMGTILATGELEKPLSEISISLTADKIHRIEAYARVAGRLLPISYGYRTPQYSISWQVYDGKIKVETGDATWNSLGCQAIIKIIYKK